jgi:hypothetical protein
MDHGSIDDVTERVAHLVKVRTSGRVVLQPGFAGLSRETGAASFKSRALPPKVSGAMCTQILDNMYT